MNKFTQTQMSTILLSESICVSFKASSIDLMKIQRWKKLNGLGEFEKTFEIFSNMMIYQYAISLQHTFGDRIDLHYIF